MTSHAAKIKKSPPSPENPLAALALMLRFSPTGKITSTETAIEILRRLVAYDTVSSHDPKLCHSNIPFTKDLESAFKALGAETFYSDFDEYPFASGINHASLVARIGPEKPGGAVFASHTDVVTVEPDKWGNQKPFELNAQGDKLIGRGAVDMKQAIVNFLAMAAFYKDKQHLLAEPIYFAFTWGEEIGCMGVKSSARLLKSINATPRAIIVNEPTSGELVVGHKGGATYQININAIGGHSSTPENWSSTNDYLFDMASFIRSEELRYRGKEFHNDNFTPPYPIINTGIITSGKSQNTVPSNASITLHLRPLPGMNVETMMQRTRDKTQEITQQIKDEMLAKNLPITSDIGASVTFISQSSALPLPKNPQTAAVLLKAVSAANGREQKPTTTPWVADSGGFSECFPNAVTVVYGLGSTSQGAHVENEFITRDQLVQGPQALFAITREICHNQQRQTGQGASGRDKLL